MSGKTVIVKLGGAAITNKKGVCELAEERQLEETLDQVQQAYQILKKAGHQLILVHGAGSFGHPQAKKYNLKAGWSNDRSEPNETYLKGYSHIRACLQQLSHGICSRLELRNVPVLAMSPIDYIETSDCEETGTEAFEAMATRVKKYLDLGFVPVLHGDAVLDHIRGCTILSGDIIMFQLTQWIPTIARCVFITDVKGIYKADPKVFTSQNDLIQYIFAQQQQQQQEHDIKEKGENETLADVTGGMQGKIKWAKRIVLFDNTIDCIICKWGSKEALDMMTLESIKNKNYQMTIVTNTPEAIASS
ncbi:Aspartate/glutamate/uridylate kinase [Pilaira anomala]|nr:Aspartate/glutamate/uridylate kinase [Pilaira anomala]